LIQQLGQDEVCFKNIERDMKHLGAWFTFFHFCKSHAWNYYRRSNAGLVGYTPEIHPSTPGLTPTWKGEPLMNAVFQGRLSIDKSKKQLHVITPMNLPIKGARKLWSYLNSHCISSLLTFFFWYIQIALLHIKNWVIHISYFYLWYLFLVIFR